MATETDSPDWAAVGFVTASTYRVRIIDALDEGPATPTKLGERSNLHISHVSRTLGNLEDRGLVELLVPDDRKKGRIYGLTDAGEAVATEVDA